MPKYEEHRVHSDDELYGVFLHGKWVTHAPVFTERQTAESWLMTRKPPDGYKGAVVKNLRVEARELRKKAARVLVAAEQESANLLAAGHLDDELYGVFHKGKLVIDAPVFTEKQTAEIWLLDAKAKAAGRLQGRGDQKPGSRMEGTKRWPRSFGQFFRFLSGTLGGHAANLIAGSIAK
jgi:hypothetical protein